MENIRGYRDDMLLFHAIIKKNINFLRRSSKKYDFIIENILEGVNIIDDIRIIELYFERNEQAIKETDIKYGKLCHKLSYNVLNNRQDSEECVNTTYLEVWNRIPPTRPAKFKAYISIIVRDISIDKLRHLTAKKRSADMVMALDELTEIREFPYNAVVELVNPVADTVSRKTYTGADVDWYVKAENIVLKNKGNQNAGSPQNHTPQGQPKK